MKNPYRLGGTRKIAGAKNQMPDDAPFPDALLIKRLCAANGGTADPHTQCRARTCVCVNFLRGTNATEAARQRTESFRPR